MTREPIRTDVDLFSLPPGLPAPTDDGAARHLPGTRLPVLRLRSSRGGSVDVAVAGRELSVFVCYPATVAPGIPIPGEWSEIPGARGCTLENCGYRDNYPAFEELGCKVYGVSGQGQDPEQGLREQIEFAERTRLPYPLLNDSDFRLASALKLPTFVARLKEPTLVFEGKTYTFPLQGRRLLKRLTFVADQGRIEKVFYPVFPPDRSAQEVLTYLHQRDGRSSREARPASRPRPRGRSSPGPAASDRTGL